MGKHGNGRGIGSNIVKVRRNENPGCWRSSRRCLHRRLIKPRPELGGGENVLSFIKRVSVNSGQGGAGYWGHVGLTSQWQVSNTSQMQGVLALIFLRSGGGGGTADRRVGCYLVTLRLLPASTRFLLLYFNFLTAKLAPARVRVTITLVCTSYWTSRLVCSRTGGFVVLSVSVTLPVFTVTVFSALQVPHTNWVVVLHTTSTNKTFIQCDFVIQCAVRALRSVS